MSTWLLVHVCPNHLRCKRSQFAPALIDEHFIYQEKKSTFQPSMNVRASTALIVSVQIPELLAETNEGWNKSEVVLVQTGVPRLPILIEQSTK